ncbi:MAG: tetratricopeptide repeat protein [Treponema sp.]|jgi:tetratricopeptide (TPR) repeat protein|nr:tetratricopeptide repeat protein [Treponema sp.]
MKNIFNGSGAPAEILNKRFIKVKLQGSLLKRLLLLLLILTMSTVIWCQDNSTESIMTEIARFLERRDYVSALDLFNTLPFEYAQNTGIMIMRASILNAAGRSAEAKLIANNIIAADSRNTDALMILADAAALENRDRERRTFLDRVIGINPNHTRALNDLANINLGNANLRMAANYFDRALEADPNNADALVGRASVYRYTRDPVSAERLLNHAIDLYPEWAGPFQERARLYKSYGFYDDAIEDFNAALQIEPDNYWILVDYGQTLMEVDLKEASLAVLERAVRISPNDFMAYAYTSAIKDELGDYAGAERDYLMLAKLKPDYYFAYEALGVIRMRNKQWAGARDAFLEAYRYAPLEFSYALLAAVNWMRAGRQTDPRQFLSQVIRTAPRDSLDYSMLRLYYDLSGDSNVTIMIENERNIYEKSRMLYYLASYYDIRGNRTLAERYYLMVQDMDAVNQLEWRINEMILAERGLGLRNAK